MHHATWILHPKFREKGRFTGSRVVLDGSLTEAVLNYLEAWCISDSPKHINAISATRRSIDERLTGGCRKEL